MFGWKHLAARPETLKFHRLEAGARQVSGRILTINLLCIALAAGGCLLPTSWISFLAAVLLLWLPGRFLVQLLPQINTGPGAGWSSIAASLVLLPVPLHWVWRVSNDRLAVLGVATVISVLLAIPACRRGTRPSAAPMAARPVARLSLAVLVVWVAACVFLAYWLPGAGGRTVPVPIHDYVKHHAVMLSLEQHPLPLHNIFYAAEAGTPYYYYEYHYLIPAALRAMTGNRVSIGFAFGFTAAAVAASFIALVFLMARHHLQSEAGALLAAACVSIVGGWDVLPTLVRLAGGGPLIVTLDAWCPVAWRIHNFMTQFLWCPQHVAAMLGLVLSCRWLQVAPEARWWIVLAPLLGASLFGSSVYLAMTVFPAAALYLLLRLRSAGHGGPDAAWRMGTAIVVIAALGALLSGTQAWHYLIMSRRYPGGLTWDWDRFPLALFGRMAPPGVVANLLDAPWLILLDFGLPALACLLIGRVAWSVIWRDDGTRLLLLAGGVGTAALFTLRSSISAVDYSFRISILPAMVLGAICAGMLMDAEKVRPVVRSWRRPVILMGILLGLPVGLYEAPLTALRTLVQASPVRSDANAIRFLRDSTPPEAVVQGEPRGRVTLPQLMNRQMGVLNPSDPDVRVFYPLEPARMASALADVESAFSTKSSESAYALLRAWGVTHVLAGSLEGLRFGSMDQFRDTDLFESVYNDGTARVYRLRGLTPGQ